MKTLDFVYFNAGGGHRAAALALQAVIEQQQRPWTVRLIDLSRVLDPQSNFRRVMGFDPEDFYNKRLQRGWTLGLAQELKLLQGAIRFVHASMLRQLQRHWAQTEPDLVVSLVPNFNRVLCESVASALPGVPFVTVMTDMADHPPHFWIEPGLAQTLVCGTPRARDQARAAGYDKGQLVLTSGMVLKPTFYDLPPMNRATRRIALGLDPLRPTGVVMFGGQGSQQMLRIARELDGVQLILMCGRNEPLAGQCRTLRRSAKQAVVGFTDEVADVMRLADFFIGKPGPGAISEAVQLGLPVITIRNAWTMPQERYNAQWVREQGVGLVVPSLSRIAVAADEMLQRLPEFHAATARIDNRALFEVTAVVAGLLTASATVPLLQWQQPHAHSDHGGFTAPLGAQAREHDRQVKAHGIG
jgi:UDP-N-acetylglucosamine:LPS N-acetylglucosamine transferase